MIYKHISELIGNTPLLEIDPKVHGLKKINLYAKLEYYNPFGSIKDRVAYGMIKDEIDRLQKSKQTVLESSSGNTAKALAALCATYDIPFKTITSRIKISEVRMILQALGAQIEELPNVSECPDPFDPNDFLAFAQNLAKTEPEKYYLTDQYFNEKNPETHYATTGKELLDDLKKVDYFIGFLGTCGSSFGIGKHLRETNPQTQIIGVVSSPGNDVPGGRMANELWEVGFFKKDFYDHIVEGTSREAIMGMLELNRRCGMLCGPTTGLNYYAGLRKLQDIERSLVLTGGEKVNAVFIACDRMEWYTSYLKKNMPELFSGTTTSKPRVSDISDELVDEAPQLVPAEADEILRNGKGVAIDLRGSFAYSIGHIKDSWNILDDLFSQIVEMGHGLPKNKTIIVVCSVGDISRKYATFLKRAGYDAYSVKGGITEWKRSGLPLERSV
ncbi:MAG TPA: pyridoxal-phosphate dependent enzyme [Candidatus Paceibacterota bacterium]|nr:pyridoxal-phosphate dependent enzyme [Candidatus Paceibacterota bacterium]